MNANELRAVSAAVVELQGVLAGLYALRRGHVDTYDAEGNPLLGWCASCGEHVVCVRDGEDTCAACLRGQ